MAKVGIKNEKTLLLAEYFSPWTNLTVFCLL